MDTRSRSVLLWLSYYGDWATVSEMETAIIRNPHGWPDSCAFRRGLLPTSTLRRRLKVLVTAGLVETRRVGCVTQYRSVSA